MSKQLKIGRKGWRRITGAAAGLALVGAAMLAPLSANATLVRATAPHAKTVLKAADKAGMVGFATTRALPEPGTYGPAFPPAPTAGPVTPRVVGGVLASSADFPSVVGIQSLYWNFDAEAWYIVTCTGTVLSPTKVLTAGHCITDLPFGTTVVIAGRDNLASNSSGFVSRVGSTWTHPNFNLANLATEVPHDDVSVLTLKDPLPAAYTPVTLAGQADFPLYAPGTAATIVGYGVTASGAGDPGVLHKATTAIASNVDCTSALPGYDALRNMCAGGAGLGIDTCGGDSGGPIFAGAIQVGITDWGPNPCGSSYGVYENTVYYGADIAADLLRPTLVNLDWTGDGHSDLFARRPNGDLIQFSGSGFGNDGFGGFSASSLDGQGWQIYTKLFRVTNWNGNGRPAIMGRDSVGNLYLYKGTGDGFFDGNRVQVGNGWNMFADIMVTNNWTGDGRPNLMGRTANGDLYLYTSDGNGGWLNNGVGIKIGTAWNMFNTVLTPGPWKGDGAQSLIGRTPAGDLYLYTSNGAGGWQNNGAGVKIGNGWNVFTTFMSPGDWNGDNMIDMVGVQPDGVVKLYKSDAHGNWLENGTGQLINTGWNQFNAIF